MWLDASFCNAKESQADEMAEVGRLIAASVQAVGPGNSAALLPHQPWGPLLVFASAVMLQIVELFDRNETCSILHFNEEAS